MNQQNIEKSLPTGFVKRFSLLNQLIDQFPDNRCFENAFRGREEFFKEAASRLVLLLVLEGL
jgi:hypothetical protein